MPRTPDHLALRRLAATAAVAVAAATAACGPAPASDAASPRPQVTVAQGRLSGTMGRNAGIEVYRGVPFAAAPIGDRRWQPPQPPATWTDVRAADAFAPSCIQDIVEARDPWTYEFMTHGEVSEDCLFLNVWAPADRSAAPYPVFVYIHGGANREGSGAVPVYDGEGLATKGLVVVTINYRLGVLGFLAHPELTAGSDVHASGNYGLLDQIAAVRWVHDNIAAFGGDPTRIAVAGQSAGAQGVHNLTASPLAAGLFSRAIAESGSSINTFRGGRPLTEAEADGVRFAQAKGATSMADLRAMSWQDIVAPLPDDMTPPLRFGPVVDGYALPESVGAIFRAGRQNDVPTLTGANADEGGASPVPITLEAYQAQARERFGADAATFLQLYPATNDPEATRARNTSARDQARVSLALWAGVRGTTASTDAYTYFWTHPLPGPDVGTYGAFHTSEVPYALNTLDMSDRPFTDVDRQIADQVSSYWAAFTASGNPNTDDLPAWPSYAAEPDLTMALGDDPGPIPIAVSTAARRFWTRVLQQ